MYNQIKDATTLSNKYELVAIFPQQENPLTNRGRLILCSPLGMPKWTQGHNLLDFTLSHPSQTTEI